VRSKRERLERSAADPLAPLIGVKPLVGRAGVFRVRMCFKWPAASPGPEDVTIEDDH
jgi:hypothetical protein